MEAAGPPTQPWISPICINTICLPLDRQQSRDLSLECILLFDLLLQGQGQGLFPLVRDGTFITLLKL